MALNQSSSVYAIRNFPIGCGPVPHPSYDHHHHIQDDDDQDYEPFEDLDDLIEITDDISNNFGFRFEFGLKRKISAIRNFPPGCGMGVLGYGNGYDYDYLEDDYEELEYSNWFDSEEVIIEDEISASSPLCDRVLFGSDKEGQESGRKLGVVLALVAPQFCPWRNGKGRSRKVKKQKLSVD